MLACCVLLLLALALPCSCRPTMSPHPRCPAGSPPCRGPPPRSTSGTPSRQTWSQPQGAITRVIWGIGGCGVRCRSDSVCELTRPHTNSYYNKPPTTIEITSGGFRPCLSQVWHDRQVQVRFLRPEGHMQLVRQEARPVLRPSVRGRVLHADKAAPV